MAAAHADDLVQFRDRHRLYLVLVVNVASTEPCAPATRRIPDP